MPETMWSRLSQSEIDELIEFLLPREEACVGFTGRILARGKPRLPSPLKGGVFVERSECVKSAVLLAEHGVLFPIFGPKRKPKADEKLAEFIHARCPKPATMLGLPEDSEYLCELLGISPAFANEYFTMTIAAESEAAALRSPFPGLRVRRARASDIERIYPLQEAYEREEVITPIHKFSPEGAMAGLQRALKGMTILICEYDGEVIAKAGTNAHGFAYDQIGGIYVKEEFRGRGIGSYLCSSLIRELLGKGRKVSLFVKKRNAQAIAAYKKTGFRMLSSFRIGYFA